ncbi:PREDICTED: uncharacterized protein LOC109591887 [Amphimedon queenslandica]|nr:PREDICTED: uncharacterized protein LOC109591887 [Amphimedon queenslandica]|eukprot:XP_019863050.1 PREDICTED: uncharacterized protein LOC109591887 [Amphimedon queenslandica]
MSDNHYRALRDHVVREVLSHSHSIDNIESRCHLLELVNCNQPRPNEADPKPVFDPSNLSNVLKWFEDCGLEYPKEIVQYQQRHQILVPKPKKNCCCLWMTLTLIFLLLFSITFIISLVVIFLKPKVMNVNVRDPQNKTYPIIGLSTNVKLECYDTSITDTVNATAITLDSATIYTIPEHEVSTYQQVLPYINLNKCMSTTSSIHTLPIPVSYNTCYEPIYTASGGGTLNYSIDLVNSNPVRVSCAMRLFGFSIHSDYISYYNAARDPQADQPRSVYSSDCVGSNGTHSFSITLPRNSLLYFVLAVVNQTKVNVSISGNISAYLNEARYRGDECHLTHSNKSCSINFKKSRHNSDVCLFVNSTYAFQGKVNLFTTFITKQVYIYLSKYWIPSIPLGLFTLLFLFLLFAIIYAKRRKDC